MKRVLLLTYVLIFCNVILVAQDIHFSQFYQSPLTLNPALTGQFDGDYRFAGNYRNQWSSVTVPFQTFSLSVNAREPFKQKDIGAGILFVHDHTGDSKFRTTIFNVSGAYKFKINTDSTQFLSVGGMFGVTRKSLNFQFLTFDAQYNGFQYDASLPNGESFTNSRQTLINVHLGVSHEWNFGTRNKLTSGIAGFNLTSPKESYFGNKSIALDRRIVLHSQLNYQVAQNYDVIPTLLYMNQGTYNEFVLGALGKFVVDDTPGVMYKAAYAGILFRTRDAGYLTAGYQYRNWDVSISYDFNFSTLTPASNGLGGIELAAIYILKQFKPQKVKHRICPDYI